MAIKEKQVTEKFLQWVWQNQLLNLPLLTTNGIEIKVLSPGILNFEDGPDFRNARLQLGNDVVEGDIEFHLLSSDWSNHAHHLDPKYNNVLLHIVWHHDSCNAVTKEMKSLLTLELSRYVTKLPVKQVHYKSVLKAMREYRCHYAKNFNIVTDILESEGINRFNDRKQKFSDLITLYGVEQSVYLGVMESLGYVKNEAPFIRLANLLPVEKLLPLIAGKSREERVKIIKTSLLGVADLLPWEFRTQWNKIKSEFNETMKKEEWQFFKVRPSAFPTRRIEGISYFLTDTIESGIYNSFKLALQDLNRLENILVQQWSTSTGISRSCARTTILNVCLPMLAIYEGQEKVCQIYYNYKKLPENNITKLMSRVLFGEQKKFSTEIYYQGILRIYHRYCYNKQCNACPIHTNPSYLETIDKNRPVM